MKSARREFSGQTEETPAQVLDLHLVSQKEFKVRMDGLCRVHNLQANSQMYAMGEVLLVGRRDNTVTNFVAEDEILRQV